MKKKQISLSSMISRSGNQVSTELDDETVLMSIEQGQYFSMDGILSKIWTLVETPVKVSALCDALLEEYEVEREQCEKDVLDVLKELADEELIQIVE